MKPIHIITLIAFLASMSSSVSGLFLVVFPLFSYYRWKGKDVKDYMLTKENLDKMRENQKNNKI